MNEILCQRCYFPAEIDKQYEQSNTNSMLLLLTLFLSTSIYLIAECNDNTSRNGYRWVPKISKTSLSIISSKTKNQNYYH